MKPWELRLSQRAVEVDGIGKGGYRRRIAGANMFCCFPKPGPEPTECRMCTSAMALGVSVDSGGAEESQACKPNARRTPRQGLLGGLL
jgi:hypothetical protein